MKTRLATILAALMSAAACLNASAAWYDDPSIIKKVPVAQNVKTHPHFINKSADDSLLLVNLNASDDNAAPVLLIDMASLADRSVAADEVAMSRPVSKPSEGFGSGWKGGAVSAKLGIALIGGGTSSETCAIATKGETWTKGAGLKPLATSNGYRIDGLDFSADSQYLYSNFYADSTGGETGRNNLIRWTYDAANNQLVFDKESPTSLTRIRNISVHTVNGRELVYCGEGGGTAAKVVAIDVSGDTWTEHVVSSGIDGLTGNITNVKLSNEDDANPVMYVLGRDGKLAVCKLAADGLSVAGMLRTFTSAEMLALAGGLSGEDEFVNFEVAKDGKTAFLIKRIDTTNANLCVLATPAYIESDGTQFVNTGYYVKPTSRIELDFAFVDFATTADYLQCRLFDNAAHQSTPSICASVYVGGNANDYSLAACIGDCGSFSGVWTSNSGAGTKGAYCDSTKRTVVCDELNKRIAISVDGEEVWYNDQSSARTFANTATRPLGLFGRTQNASGTTCDYQSRIRVYGFRIYEDGSLVHDYVPAIKNGVAGLLDSITGTFLYDTRTTGAGTFAYGGDIETIDDDPYIQSAGTDAINLGISASPKLKIALDYALLEGNEVQARLLGQDTKDGAPRFSVYINGSGNIALAGGTDTAFNNVSTGIATNTARHTVVIDNVALLNAYITGMTTNWTGYGTTKADCTKCAARPLALFGNTANDAGTSFNQCTKMKVYGLKIWSGGELIRDLVPRCIGGTSGFEDLVFGGFYTCDGLTASADAPTTLTGASRELDAWVESDGSGAVNTGYFDGPNTKIEVDFQLAKINASGCVAGHWNNDYTAFIWCGSGLDYFNIQGKDGGYVSAVTPSPTVYQDHARHTAVLDSPNKTFSFYAPDGTLEGSVSADSSWTYTKTSNWPFILFGGASDANGSSKSRAKVRIYGVKFYESGVLKKTFTPALQYGVVGFVDETGKFYTGDGLTGGGNIKRLEGDFFYDPIRAEDAYIESDGTQGINLGYLTTPKTRYEIDYQMTEIVGQMRPFGQATSALSAELYIQGTATGSGNVAFGVGDEWKGQASGVASDLNRHLAVLDLANRYCAYTDKGAYAFTSETVCTKTATYPMWLFAKGTSAAGAYEDRAKMKLYAFRIYESGVLVHEYLPYKNGDTVGLYDTVTGGVKLNSVNGANAFAYGGGMGYGKFAGVKTVLTTDPVDTVVKPNKAATLSAFAPGAIRYIWTRNGEVLAGAAGPEITIVWESPKKVGGTPVYGVTPVFLKDGVEVIGTESTAEVTMEPLGMVLVIR